MNKRYVIIDKDGKALRWLGGVITWWKLEEAQAVADGLAEADDYKDRAPFAVEEWTYRE